MPACRALSRVSLAMLALAAPAYAQADSAPLEIGRTFRMASRVLSEERTIDVTLPRGYATGTERYPVIVVLDGESEHEIVAAAVLESVIDPCRH